jgi:hypothetical protein
VREAHAAILLIWLSSGYWPKNRARADIGNENVDVAATWPFAPTAPPSRSVVTWPPIVLETKVEAVAFGPQQAVAVAAAVIETVGASGLGAGGAGGGLGSDGLGGGGFGATLGSAVACDAEIVIGAPTPKPARKAVSSALDAGSKKNPIGAPAAVTASSSAP